MTPEQRKKAVETRRKNKEMRDYHYQLERRIDKAMTLSLLSVLEDESSTPSQKLEASKILNDIRKGDRK